MESEAADVGDVAMDSEVAKDEAVPVSSAEKRQNNHEEAGEEGEDPPEKKVKLDDDGDQNGQVLLVKVLHNLPFERAPFCLCNHT